MSKCILRQKILPAMLKWYEWNVLKLISEIYKIIFFILDELFFLVGKIFFSHLINI